MTDRNEKEIAAHFKVADEATIRLVVDDRSAEYPLVIDPLLTEASDSLIESNQVDAALGYSVAGAGDVDGDGYGDVIVGAVNYDSGENTEGAAFVFLAVRPASQVGVPLRQPCFSRTSHSHTSVQAWPAPATSTATVMRT